MLRNAVLLDESKHGTAGLTVTDANDVVEDKGATGNSARRTGRKLRSVFDSWKVRVHANTQDTQTFLALLLSCFRIHGTR